MGSERRALLRRRRRACVSPPTSTTVAASASPVTWKRSRGREEAEESRRLGAGVRADLRSGGGAGAACVRGAGVRALEVCAATTRLGCLTSVPTLFRLSCSTSTVASTWPCSASKLRLNPPCAALEFADWKTADFNSGPVVVRGYYFMGRHQILQAPGVFRGDIRGDAVWLGDVHTLRCDYTAAVGLEGAPVIQAGSGRVIGVHTGGEGRLQVATSVCTVSRTLSAWLGRPSLILVNSGDLSGSAADAKVVEDMERILT
ncbi:hypothetical protein C2845_PM13G24700 [Panicum miliaceum]|uniref:Serine protease n=1 Tax=Panicum miliaceum TaxID=4540 RepID=A0A3L6RI64_PANMI|nr:hypothetical protein C2845_PM13G24700 [Panicum miliaceum]